MGSPVTSVLLASYTDDSGDRIEFVLPEVSHREERLIEDFLRGSYPDGSALVSVVNIASLSDFASTFGDEFTEFVAAAWRR